MLKNIFIRKKKIKYRLYEKDINNKKDDYV